MKKNTKQQQTTNQMLPKKSLKRDTKPPKKLLIKSYKTATNYNQNVVKKS